MYQRTQAISAVPPKQILTFIPTDRRLELLQSGILSALAQRMEQEDRNRTYEDEFYASRDPKIATVLKLYALLMPTEKERHTNEATIGLDAVLQLLQHRDGYIGLLALNALGQLTQINGKDCVGWKRISFVYFLV